MIERVERINIKIVDPAVDDKVPQKSKREKVSFQG
jgi:hypothetical protein